MANKHAITSITQNVLLTSGKKSGVIAYGIHALYSRVECRDAIYGKNQAAFVLQLLRERSYKTNTRAALSSPRWVMDWVPGTSTMESPGCVRAN